MEKTQKEKSLVTLLLFAITYAFLAYLNFIFPTQSDDIGRKIEGIQRAVQSYMTWNGRFGELMLVTFGSFFSTTPFYAFVNSFIGAAVIMMIFVALFGHLPQKSKKEISIYAIIFAFIMFDPVFSFGSVFYWAAGSFNYLWAWFFILLTVLPVALFWHGVKFSKSLNIFICIAGIPLAVIAGWSSEFAIVLIVFCIASIIFKKVRHEKLPVWYYTSLCAFILGWIILYKCPGMRERAKLIQSYCSLLDLLKLGPIGLTKKILSTFSNFSGKFYYENFCLISLFLLLTSLLYKPSLKKFESTVLAIFLMAFCIRSMPKIFFVLCALFICIMSAIVIKKENQFISNFFICLSGIILAEFLFIGATIQIGTPGRACFQYTILNLGIIVINMVYCFEVFRNNQKVQRIATISCLAFTLILSTFVGLECTNMNRKWNSMEKSIAEQKSQGITNVIIESKTFRSKYWGYGDWGNPGEDPSVWPNTTYASYYGVESLIAK
jgi:hypothetical protein